MKDLHHRLRRCDPDALVRDALGLAALSSGILLALFLPALG